MYDTHIEILAYKESRDEFNDRTRELVHVAFCYAQKTESGGRENLYAGRIVHENEAVYSIRWRSGIEAGMFVDDDERLMRIVSVHEEGRRRTLHLRVLKSDADDMKGCSAHPDPETDK